MKFFPRPRHDPDPDIERIALEAEKHAEQIKLLMAQMRKAKVGNPLGDMTRATIFRGPREDTSGR